MPAGARGPSCEQGRIERRCQTKGGRWQEGRRAGDAVSYGASGGQIWIRAGQDGNGSWLEVANEGPAIPLAERERIFEPFEQGSIVRQGLLKGSGMGLSIARESAMSLGGELVLVEDEQADVCFRLTLK